MKRLKLILAIFSILSLSTFSFAQDWETLETPVESNLILYQISFPSGQEDVGYTGGSNVTYNGQGKILKTTDNGDTWQVIWESDVNGTGVSAIYFSDVNNGFAGTQGGDLMVTDDGGANWSMLEIDPGNDLGEISDIDFFDDMNGTLLSSFGGVFITSDGGATWQSAAATIPGAAHYICYAGDASTLFASGDQQKIFKSENGGNNWTLNHSGPSPWMINLGINFDEDGNGLATSEDGEVFVTNDGGNSWTNYLVPGQGGLMRGALVLNANDMYITATPGAVFKSTNGGVNWSLDSDVDGSASYYSITKTDQGTLFVSGSGSSGGTILRKSGGSNPLSFNTDVENVLCNGTATGSISLEISGGIEPYSYEWSNDETSSSITNLEAGMYSCTITDADGTTIMTGDIEVLEPTAIVIDIAVTDETSIGASDGTMTATVTGGTPTYIYTWCNGENTPEIAGMPAGECCLTIIDSNNCESTQCATVNTNPTGVSEIESLISIETYPNPLIGNGDLNLKMSFSEPTNLRIEITDATGKVHFAINRPNSTLVNESLNFTAYSAGIYFVRVLDVQNGTSMLKKILKID